MLEEFFEWMRAEQQAGSVEFDIKKDAGGGALLQS